MKQYEYTKKGKILMDLYKIEDEDNIAYLEGDIVEIIGEIQEKKHIIYITKENQRVADECVVIIEEEII